MSDWATDVPPTRAERRHDERIANASDDRQRWYRDLLHVPGVGTMTRVVYLRLMLISTDDYLPGWVDTRRFDLVRLTDLIVSASRFEDGDSNV